MQSLLQFLTAAEPFIYIVLGIMGVVYLRRLFYAINDWRLAIFGLEKEMAQRSMASAFTGLGLIAVFLIAEVTVVSILSVRYPLLTSLATPTANLLSTDQPLLSGGTPGPDNVVGVNPTQAITSEGCTEGQIEWTSPIDGDTISGSVEMTGTVNVTNLGFYKYEYREQSSEIWVTIAGGSSPVVDDALGGTWDTSERTPGDYQLRLVVYDNQNNAFPACTIDVQVAAP
ncbi:MAG TPA: hypothetical protein VN376_10285 [Longilinea sp.]|nr:hypothetical protein [Longilinea sp.]